MEFEEFIELVREEMSRIKVGRNKRYITTGEKTKKEFNKICCINIHKLAKDYAIANTGFKGTSLYVYLKEYNEKIRM